MTAATAEPNAGGPSGEPASAPRLTKGQRTRQRILASALDLFRERGFQAVSLRDIGARAGITHVTVLHYFPSKDELLTELMVHRDDVERDHLSDFVLGNSDPYDPRWRGLRNPALRWFMSRLEGNESEPQAAPLFLRIAMEATAEDHSAHDHFVRRYELVRRMLSDALTDEFAHHPDRTVAVSPMTAAEQLMAISDGTTFQEVYCADATPIVDSAWAYLRLIGVAGES
ncbi:TetR/AcrR family transcriptional regulator [Humibacter ginsenosidimutans]|uniref:TetR/AcrR family transcriptional regulator n=1 Tax=Humibacter ginsenosidimutans TaxID=2599293 RepID=A0A5B8M6C6_9MICO|nr:TetR/AcrR family transcriptional regulator [Humibacter ginsenosidimutans]QDZ15325.1 TetR/AcrR family transcriptional regulator [Humibacter ginsenosidimutans]